MKKQHTEMTKEELLKTDYEKLPDTVKGTGDTSDYVFIRVDSRKLSSGENAYIYAQCYKDSPGFPIAYEVIRPNIRECVDMSTGADGKRVVKPLGRYKESYPCSEDWGKRAHTFTDKNRAYGYFKRIL